MNDPTTTIADVTEPLVAPEASDLDADAGRRLLEAVELALVSSPAGDAPRRLRLDLAHVDYVNAAGVSSLLRARTAAQTAGAALVIENACPFVARVLEVVRLDRVVEVHEGEPPRLAA